MSTTIDVESKQYSKLLVDLDRYRTKYKTKELDSLTDTKVSVQFASPYIKVYENLKFYLLKNSVRKKLPPKNFYRPDYVSYEEYGTTSLWNLILFINDIATIENFDIDEIYVPTRGVISDLIKYALSNNQVTDLDVPEVISKDIYAKLFEKKQKPVLQDVNDPNKYKQLKEQQYYFITQVFPVRNIIVSQKFVDLKYEAVEESLIFKVKEEPTFIYGIHYSLILNEGKLNRVTWSAHYNQIGLQDIIREGQILEVKYARKV